MGRYKRDNRTHRAAPYNRPAQEAPQQQPPYQPQNTNAFCFPPVGSVEWVHGAQAEIHRLGMMTEDLQSKLQLAERDRAQLRQLLSQKEEQKKDAVQRARDSACKALNISRKRLADSEAIVCDKNKAICALEESLDQAKQEHAAALDKIKEFEQRMRNIKSAMEGP
ncbi:hypothetical protein FDECE_14642 [Fusarium decemcellulare]|nr:hypothetical protein FDECE_14642 [Fusarium decemcellulare]